MVTQAELLRGRAACPGKVTGTVRIVNSEWDLSRVKEGDIMVSSMTCPEYVPVMAKAGGYITDMGGITCHAAIVAREYKKPCIVGVRQIAGNNATYLLEEGMRITLEVDNHFGTVTLAGEGD